MSSGSVANAGSTSVTVIDGATHATATVAAGTCAYSVAVNLVTNKIYVANYSGASVTVIDGATNATSTVPVGTNPVSVAVNPVTNRIYVANEGKCLVIVARQAAEAVLAALQAHPLGREAALIGEVLDDHPGRVVLRTRIGGQRIVDMLTGEQLPRIC